MSEQGKPVFNGKKKKKDSIRWSDRLGGQCREDRCGKAEVWAAVKQGRENVRDML